MSAALRFRNLPSELMLRRLFTRIFSLETLFSNQFTALLSPSAEYSQGISKLFPSPLFTLLPVILQLMLLFGRPWPRNIFIHKLKHLGTYLTTVPSFITAMAFLSSTFLGSCLHSRHSPITSVHISWYT